MRREAQEFKILGMFCLATFNPEVLIKKNIRIDGKDLKDACCCWLTCRLLFHLCFMCARSPPDLWNTGTAAKDELRQWPAELASSTRWVSYFRYVHLVRHAAYFSL